MSEVSNYAQVQNELYKKNNPHKFNADGSEKTTSPDVVIETQFPLTEKEVVEKLPVQEPVIEETIVEEIELPEIVDNTPEEEKPEGIIREKIEETIQEETLIPEEVNGEEMEEATGKVDITEGEDLFSEEAI